MLSSYTRAIQKQESMTGSLFQQKTKFKCVDTYLTTVFHYIHQNPYRAGLVSRLEEYPWSSVQEYCGLVSENLCNQEIACQFIDINKERFLADSYSVIPDDLIKGMELD